MNDEPLSFGYWIRRRRKALDLTQEALAHRVGCSLGAIRKLESDDRRPSPEMAARLAQMLDLAAEERAAFLKAAHAELAPDHLAAPTASVNIAPQSPAIVHGMFPVAATPLIGRTAEVAAVRAALEQPEVRLLTLTGPGGTGKTRLALAVATAIQDDFSAGACFVDLAPIRESSLVLPTIAAALGLAGQHEQSHLAMLQLYVREKQLLLVLDNFEQILPAAPQIAALLAAAPRFKVLVTSRAVLHLAGEHEYSVPPLALPDRHHLPALEAVAQYEAVALFIQRARAVNPDFQVNAATVPAVAKICARLDGLPLAIELAATRSRLFGPEALLARLTNRLSFLTGGARDLAMRQQTIRNTIAWSYDLLDAAQQRLFRRLAVFVGVWTLEAAEAVCTVDGDLAVDVLEGLTTLVEQSLLRQVAGSDGEPRFWRLETIHEYALEQLAASDEGDVLRRRHATYYRALAETAETALRGAQQAVWGARLEHEHDNLRAAVRWCVAQGDAESGLRLGGALWRFWAFCGHALEGRDLLRDLLALPGGGAAARATALLGAGWLAHMLADVDVAEALFEQSIVLYREVGDRWGLAFALSYYGYDMSWSNQRAAESATLFEELGEPWGLAYACVLRSELAARHGDPLGHSLGQEGVRRFRELGDRWFLFTVLDRLQGAAWLLGDASWQAQLLDDQVRLAQEGGDKAQIAGVLHGQAMEARWQGDDAQAAALYDECVALYQSLGLTLALAGALHGRGMVAYHQGEDAEAQALFVASVALFRETGHEGIGWCLEGLAGVAARQGQPLRAARLLGAGDVQEHFDTWPSDHPGTIELQEIVARARTQLDEATWDAALAEGRALTLEQAVAYALAVDDGV